MRAREWAALFGLVALATGTSAVAQFHGLAAKVNGTGISNQALDRNYEEYLRENNINVAGIRYPARIKEMRREVLELLIDQELVWQSVKAKALLAADEEIDRAFEEVQGKFRSERAFRTKLEGEGYTEASYRTHLKRVVSVRKYLDAVSAQVEVGEAEVHAFYAENPEKFQVPELVRARHILIKLSAAATADVRHAAREKMDGILAVARKTSDFAALARTHSEDASAARGGDLGYLSRAQLIKPFADAAFALSPGEISGVVETPFGLHIITVEDRQPARTVPEDQARDQIYAYLRNVKQQRAVRNLLDSLRSSAEIEVLAPL